MSSKSFIDNVESAIAKVEGKITNTFPAHVTETIFSELRKQATKKVINS